MLKSLSISGMLIRMDLKGKLFKDCLKQREIMPKPSNACMQELYDQPQFIHKACIHSIFEAPPIKDGSTRELRCLYDTLNQHMGVLKTMKYDCFDTFITAATKLKFNQSVMDKWKKFSWDCESVPLYSELLKFLSSEARGVYNMVGESEQRCPVVMQGKKTISRPSYAVIINDICLSCGKAKHSLYSCKTFQVLSHEWKVGVVEGNKLFMNCLGSRHFVRDCPSGQRCRSVTSHTIRDCTLMPWARIIRHPKRAHTLGIVGRC